MPVRTQHCLPTTPNIVGCYTLRPLAHPVASCWAKFETGQTFQPTTPNISFIPWSPKRSATMLDPFAQFFQHCWGHARSLHTVYKDLWVVSLPRCTAGPNIVGATMLGVVAAVCTQPKVRLMSRLSRECTCKSCNNHYCIRFGSTGNSGTQILY